MDQIPLGIAYGYRFMKTGLQKWQVALGELIRWVPTGFAPDLARKTTVGPVHYKAGGRVIIAATKDEIIRAFEKETAQYFGKLNFQRLGLHPAVYERMESIPSQSHRKEAKAPHKAEMLSMLLPLRLIN